MKNTLQLIIIFLFTTVLHWALASFGAGFNISINFMLAVAMVVCSRYYRWYGYTFAFLGGIFLDFFGVNMFGAYALTFTLCAAAVYMAKNILDFESAAPQVLMIFLISIASVLVYNFTGIIFIKGTAWHGFGSLVFGAAANAVCGAAVFT